MIPNRVVIDTNVCLDLFVFRDERYLKLIQALRAGRLEAVTDAACRKEWLFVLGYSHLPLDDSARQTAITDYDSVIAPTENPCRDAVVLPVCKDKEDQKFLELARDSHASLLLTKDKALLKLAKRTVKKGLFAILSPDQWLGEQATGAADHGLHR